MVIWVRAFTQEVLTWPWYLVKQCTKTLRLQEEQEQMGIFTSAGAHCLLTRPSTRDSDCSKTLELLGFTTKISTFNYLLLCPNLGRALLTGVLNLSHNSAVYPQDIPTPALPRQLQKWPGPKRVYMQLGISLWASPWLSNGHKNPARYYRKKRNEVHHSVVKECNKTGYQNKYSQGYTVFRDTAETKNVPGQ